MSRWICLFTFFLFVTPSLAQRESSLQKIQNPIPLDQHKVLRSLKTSFVHLPAEIFRFSTAIVIVRLTTCFGPSLWNAMSFQPKARVGDPACLTELAQMFSDPVFYAGFSAFVMTSRVTSPILIKALRALDPKNGPISQATVRLFVPQLALAAGFISDHIVKSLLHNKDIQQCLLNLAKKSKNPKSIFDSNKEDSLGSFVDENGEQFLVMDYYDLTGGSSCRRAAQFIESDQFLKEELAVGIVGLLSSAMALSTFGAGTSWIVHRIAGNAAMGRISIVLSATTGPVGIATGITRMVFFLFLYEWIHPYIASIYHSGFMGPKTNQMADAFYREHREYKKTEGKLDKEEHRQSGGFKTKIPQQEEPKKCAQYYGGLPLEGGEPLCTEVPLLSEMISFHDYSRAWRSKKILGKFHLSVSRWQKKLKSFFDNYDSTREQIRYLSRSREIYLTGQSEEHTQMVEDITKAAGDLLKTQAGLSQEDVESTLEQINQEVVKQQTDPGYISPVLDLDPMDPHRSVFETLRFVFDQQSNFELNKTGDYYFGLYAMDYRPDSGEVEFLIDKILEFIDEGSLVIHHPQSFYQQTPYLIQNRLADLEFSKFDPFVSLPEKLRLLIASESETDRVYGLILFRNLAPFMYHSENFPPLPYAENFEEIIAIRGFSQERFFLYQDIVHALEHHDPIFQWEFFYLMGATFGDLGEMTKEESHSQWSKTNLGFETSKLYAYSLTQLICGSETISHFFKNEQGWAMEFHFPRLLQENLCKYLYQPVFDSGKSHPSVTRSQFVSSEALHIGLHQAYIQAPKDKNNPLLFDTEAQAQKWWDQSIVPENIHRLKAMKNSYRQMVEEEFIPYIDSKKPKSYEDLEGGIYTTTESLTTSILNEFHYYHQILLDLLDPSQREGMDQRLKGLGQCFTRLLKSIPEKKYKEAEKQCQQSPASVIRALRYQDGKLDEARVQNLLRQELDDHPIFTDMDKARKAENESRQGWIENREDFIRDRIFLELSQMISNLFGEIFMYNQTVNELFDFDFEKRKVKP